MDNIQESDKKENEKDYKNGLAPSPNKKDFMTRGRQLVFNLNTIYWECSFQQKIEKLHQPNTSIVFLSNTTKATISHSMYILYILLLHHCTSINVNC